MAKYLDQDGLLYFWQQLKTIFAGKVDKVDGKGLSTNDFTTADQTKLNGIAAGAEVNVIDSIMVNGTAVTVTSKTAALTVPTKTSEITNDSGYITTADIPEGAAASTTTPLMDGEAAVGTELAFARGDHRHPSDSTKVDKVTGKGLSTNDFTDNEKNKLDGISASVGTGALAGLTTLTIPGNDGGENPDEYLLVNSDGMQGVQTLLNQKAPLASPDLTGTPTAPTATAGTNTTQIATTAFIQTALGSYVTTATAESTYAKKTDIANAYVYKGSVASVSDLPSTGNKAGDVYNVEATGMNYAWTGTAWDDLGGTFTIVSITNAEIDAIIAA